MKWQATLLAIAAAASGCGDLDPCPGSDVCGRDDSILTKNRCGCECQASQKTDPEHMCCDAAEGCTEDNNDPDPGSGMTPSATNPRLFVGGLNAVVTATAQFDIRACEGFTVLFGYRNQSNGTLQAPSDYGLPNPMLTFEEVGIGTASVPAPRPVPWSTGLAPGANDNKSEEYGDGINPNNTSQSTSVVVEVALLPLATSGVTAINKDIGRFGNTCT
jgi:hypothetical protein